MPRGQEDARVMVMGLQALSLYPKPRQCMGDSITRQSMGESINHQFSQDPLQQDTSASTVGVPGDIASRGKGPQKPAVILEQSCLPTWCPSPVGNDSKGPQKPSFHFILSLQLYISQNLKPHPLLLLCPVHPMPN
ncbi:uncharacterized protein WM294_000593 [Sarcoramphus papa]